MSEQFSLKDISAIADFKYRDLGKELTGKIIGSFNAQTARPGDNISFIGIVIAVNDMTILVYWAAFDRIYDYNLNTAINFIDTRQWIILQ